MRICLLFAVGLMLCISAFGQSRKLDTVRIKTSAVCEMCKFTLEKDMAFEKGIKTADLDVATKMLTITFNPKKTSVDNLKKAVSRVGYDADDLPADFKAYEGLDDCCKKDAHKGELPHR